MTRPLISLKIAFGFVVLLRKKSFPNRVLHVWIAVLKQDDFQLYIENMCCRENVLVDEVLFRKS